MRPIGVYDLATVTTLCGLTSAVLSCILSTQGRLDLAVLALIWAGIFDLLDGPIARRGERTAYRARFGVEIDNVSDAISFGAAPVTLAAAASSPGPLGIAILAAYAAAASIRLAAFGAEKDGATPTRVYRGLPVTFAALVLGLAFTLRHALPQSVFEGMLFALLAVLAVAYVTPVPLRKPTGAVYGVMPVLAIVLSAFYLAAAGTVPG